MEVERPQDPRQLVAFDKMDKNPCDDFNASVSLALKEIIDVVVVDTVRAEDDHLAATAVHLRLQLAILQSQIQEQQKIIDSHTQTLTDRDGDLRVKEASLAGAQEELDVLHFKLQAEQDKAERAQAEAIQAGVSVAQIQAEAEEKLNSLQAEYEKVCQTKSGYSVAIDQVRCILLKEPDVLENDNGDGAFSDEKLQQAVEACEALVDTFKTQQALSTELEKQLAQTTAEQAHSKAIQAAVIESSRAISDEHVQALWIQLRAEISDLTTALLVRYPKPKELDPDLRASMLRLANESPVGEEFFRDEPNMKHHLESYIWHSLSAYWTVNSVWKGDKGREFRQAVNAMRQALPKDDANALKDFSHWRAQGVHLLRQAVDAQHDHQAWNEQVQKTVSYLIPFLSKTDRDHFEQILKLHTSLGSIFTLAQKLDDAFSESLAHWAVVWQPAKYFNRFAMAQTIIPGTVNYETQPGRVRIRMHTSPLLRRSGNADGTGYEESTVIMKGGVI